ncbi:hypothetical protein SLE2022_060990 [Rubroshorea leprosula]
MSGDNSRGSNGILGTSVMVHVELEKKVEGSKENENLDLNKEIIDNVSDTDLGRYKKLWWIAPFWLTGLDLNIRKAWWMAHLKGTFRGKARSVSFLEGHGK